MQTLNGYSKKDSGPTIWGGIAACTGLFFPVALGVLTGLVPALVVTWAIGGVVGIRPGELTAPLLSRCSRPR